MTDAFRERFGRPAEVVAAAHGRVNLMGDHTDYNRGLVLPVAIPPSTTVELARRDDDRVVAVSTAFAEPGGFRIGDEQRTGTWIDYVAGITRILRVDGRALPGFDVRVDSALPLGGGLSSSAALEIALLRALRSLLGLALDDRDLADIAHRAETRHVGVPVGMLDQLACSLADPEHALFIDIDSLALERIAMPRSFELIVIDSGVAHDHASGDYRTRRAECERAAELLGVASLRDAPEDAPARLPAPLDRRVRHVSTENARVRAAVAALRTHDAAAFGRLMWQSHASLRDDFAVSVPAVDAIVDRASRSTDVYGARMTGGGFGGAVIVAVRPGRAAAMIERIGVDRRQILVGGDQR